MGEIRSYRDLDVWQLGMQIGKESYFLTRSFPREELYGFTSQIRRSAVSIPANIAEGYGRDSRREYLQFLRIAQGSLKELETHLLLAADVNLTSAASIELILKLCEQTGRMLHSLIRKLQELP